MVFLLSGFVDDHLDESTGFVWLYCGDSGGGDYGVVGIISVGNDKTAEVSGNGRACCRGSPIE